MSKSCRSILPVFAVLTALIASADGLAAQDIEITIRLAPEKSIAHVEGRYLRATAPQGPLVFLSDYSGIGLAHDRIDNIKQSGTGWSYDVKVPRPKGIPLPVSWLTESSGALKLDELLPRLGGADAGVSIELPSRWRSSWFPKRVNTFSNTVILVGTDLLQSPVACPAAQISLFVDGKWTFSDQDAYLSTKEICNEYGKVFGSLHQYRIQIGLMKPSDITSSGTWEADTVGSNITIVSSDMPFKSQSLQRLHEQLRHEMFHLWIPEGVNLTGNYDWFYEGFALYQSLKLGVAVNRLRFEDYLNSLNQAYAIDRRLAGKMSLIDVSKNRWSGDNNSVVYARGMLVAFLSDLAMLEASKGKRSTDDIVREVYQKHGGQAAPQDGNAAVMAMMKQRPELVPIIERYVTGSEKLDWTPFLAAAGLEAAGPNNAALKTVAKPNSRQKKLLDKLGYNNWRKLSSTRK